ncbi:hypothetical protein SAMN05444008_117107 [Cnuella takakiae]|uniref:Long-chain fatty acid transport protein n=1 Tax=Cnuella takakiae TaxID=1302690 RepID=A0A1M5GYW0_9BACT|nr:hypothetical protein [Cnuella takakiae]OLY90846.1 hypothetical protein BUE76_02250 [Cnuella takakiae]SHG08652.1 hypothetical protein SAMN05444008_117107 [Cnuella takakiae]
MQSVKSTAAGKRNKLRACGVAAAALLLGTAQVSAQENAPYSRYGLGELVPNTHVLNRGMGGISAGYANFLEVNANNPASYSAFKTFVEERSKKAISGRVLLDVGITQENRTLQSPNQTNRFSSANLYFSYVQLGIPLNRNWGLSFGLRPVSRINYKISRFDRLQNPGTGTNIDSAYTEFNGAGGANLPYIGTGYAIKNLSIGANVGYMFGRKEYDTRRSLLNDSISYYSSKHSTQSYFSGLFYNAGVQYKIDLNKKTFLRLGVSGNWKQTLNTSTDLTRETIVRDQTNGDSRLDSAYAETDRKGEVIIPASYTYGFVLEHQDEKGPSWLLGADLVQSKWNQYRFNGARDSVQDNWQIRVGGQWRPEPGSNYFSNVSYRLGFFTGADYIRVGRKLPQYGVSLGLGLPIANYNRLSPGQFTMLNLGFEFIGRGNNENTLKENLFRVSAGFSFSDLWFNKRKYD